MYQLNIDTKEITRLTGVLRDLHKAAYPNTVRQTLNDLAFDVKQRQMPITAKQIFTVRNPNMFKVFSKVDKATGWDVGAMRAEAGMLNKGAGRTFDEQEEGGTYKHENVPLASARVGGNKKGKIQSSNYLKKGLIDRSKKTRNRSARSQFIADAYMSKKLGLPFRHNKTIFRASSFSRLKKGDIRIKLRALYTSKTDQSVNVKATKFIEKTALQTINIKAEKFYKRAANQQFKKFFK